MKNDNQIEITQEMHTSLRTQAHSDEEGMKLTAEFQGHDPRQEYYITTDIEGQIIKISRYTDGLKTDSITMKYADFQMITELAQQKKI